MFRLYCLIISIYTIIHSVFEIFSNCTIILQNKDRSELLLVLVVGLNGSSECTRYILSMCWELSNFIWIFFNGKFNRKIDDDYIAADIISFHVFTKNDFLTYFEEIEKWNFSVTHKLPSMMMVSFGFVQFLMKWHYS